MHEEKGKPGQTRSVDRRPPITADMFWPGPRKEKAPASERAARAAGAGSAASRLAAAPRPTTSEIATVISMAEAASRAASRMNHPSVRSKRVEHLSLPETAPEPVLVLGERGDTVDLSDCGNGCGKGRWCQACRSDIRSEALRWLQELNVVRPLSGTNLLWGPAWSREFLLADY